MKESPHPSASPLRDSARALRSQRGLGMVELILAGFLGLTLIGMGGYLFKNQVEGFLDIRDEARVQGGFKKALQAMVRQISNAGACLPDPMDHFSNKPEKFTFAYMDIGGNFCSAGGKVIVSFYSRPGESQDVLMQDIDCGSGKRQSRALASVPKGGLALSFRYLDKKGNATVLPTQVRSVEIDLKLQTGKAKAGKRLRKTRQQTVRVQCVNL